MRIDQLLNTLCLMKTRSMAKKACDSNLVKLNGKVSKASTIVSDGDEIEYSVFGWNTKLKIEKIPVGNVSKKTAPEYYTIIERFKEEGASD